MAVFSVGEIDLCVCFGLLSSFCEIDRMSHSCSGVALSIAL